MKLLKKYGIKFVDNLVVKKEKEVDKACKKLGFPLVMKVISSVIVHKTEAKAVKLDINDNAAAATAFKELRKLKGFKAALLQKQISGKEIIIGGKQDPQFGPTVLFGLGGIYVELLKDVSIRVCPITEKDAEQMIHELKGLKLLEEERKLSCKL